MRILKVLIWIFLMAHAGIIASGVEAIGFRPAFIAVLCAIAYALHLSYLRDEVEMSVATMSDTMKNRFISATQIGITDRFQESDLDVRKSNDAQGLWYIRAIFYIAFILFCSAVTLFSYWSWSSDATKLVAAIFAALLVRMHLDFLGQNRIINVVKRRLYEDFYELESELIAREFIKDHAGFDIELCFSSEERETLET